MGSSGAGGDARAAAAAVQQLAAPCDKYTDCRLIKVYNVADTVWSQEFQRRGAALPGAPDRVLHRRRPDRLRPRQRLDRALLLPAPTRSSTSTSGFLQQLQDQFGAQGQFAQAYIVAHEFGHHLQTLLGTEPKVRAAQERNPSLANQYSVALELQADCYAGVWANLADQSRQNGINLTPGQHRRGAERGGGGRRRPDPAGDAGPGQPRDLHARHRAAAQATGSPPATSRGDIDSCDTFSQG